MTQYKLVPVEPTPEMMKAGVNVKPYTASRIYAAMLAAAPKPDVVPVAMRYGFDGYGYHYIDSGSGSDWRTRIDDAEPLYTHPQPTKQPLSQYAIDRIVGSLQVQWPDYFDLEAATTFARAIEAEHGIGIIPDSRIENTAPYTADAIAELEQEARLMRALIERLEGENKVMLQALKRASDLLARYPKHHDAWAESRAAIAKVEAGHD